MALVAHLTDSNSPRAHHQQVLSLIEESFLGLLHLCCTAAGKRRHVTPSPPTTAAPEDQRSGGRVDRTLSFSVCSGHAYQMTQQWFCLLTKPGTFWQWFTDHSLSQSSHTSHPGTLLSVSEANQNSQVSPNMQVRMHRHHLVLPLRAPHRCGATSVSNDLNPLYYVLIQHCVCLCCPFSCFKIPIAFCRGQQSFFLILTFNNSKPAGVQCTNFTRLIKELGSMQYHMWPRGGSRGQASEIEVDRKISASNSSSIENNILNIFNTCIV